MIGICRSIVSRLKAAMGIFFGYCAAEVRWGRVWMAIILFGVGWGIAASVVAFGLVNAVRLFVARETFPSWDFLCTSVGLSVGVQMSLIAAAFRIGFWRHAGRRGSESWEERRRKGLHWLTHARSDVLRGRGIAQDEETDDEGRRGL